MSSSVHQQDNEERLRSLHKRDLLSMRKPTKLDRIKESIPKPKEILPSNPLPLWKAIPLEQKIPAVPCPDGVFHLSRNPLGESIFLSKAEVDFDTLDPFIQETPIEYEPLHDPNLKYFFQKNPGIVKNLQDHGMINHLGKVTCNLSDFNKYRLYISRLHKSKINEEQAKQSRIEDAEFKKTRTIKAWLSNETRHSKLQDTLTRRDEINADREARRELISQRSERSPFMRVKEERERITVEKAFKNNFLQYKSKVRLEQMKSAQLSRLRKMVIKWHCEEQMRNDLRKSICQHRKATRQAELEVFVDAKREFQENKLRYERAILQKYQAERACQISKRDKHYKHMEDERFHEVIVQKDKEKAKNEREMYLLKKYASKWMEFVMAHRFEHSSFKVSLWCIREQLRSMAAELKEESGAISFTSFIQGLIKLKPGKKPLPEMNQETRTIINYILDLLIRKTLKELSKRAMICHIDMASDEYKNKRHPCCREPDLNEEDFEPPKYKRMTKPIVPFESPFLPYCVGPCTQFRKNDYNKKEWSSKCEGMAAHLQLVHDEIADYLKDRLLGDINKAAEIVIHRKKLKPYKTSIKSVKEKPLSVDETSKQKHSPHSGHSHKNVVSKVEAPKPQTSSLPKPAVNENSPRTKPNQAGTSKPLQQTLNVGTSQKVKPTKHDESHQRTQSKIGTSQKVQSSKNDNSPKTQSKVGPSQEIKPTKNDKSNKPSPSKIVPTPQVKPTKNDKPQHQTSSKMNKSKQNKLSKVETSSNVDASHEIAMITASKMDTSHKDKPSKIDTSPQTRASETAATQQIDNSKLIDTSIKITPSITETYKNSQPVRASESKMSQQVRPSQDNMTQQVNSSQTDTTQQVKPSTANSSQQVGPSTANSSQQVRPSTANSSQQVRPSTVSSSQQVRPSMANSSQQVSPSNVGISKVRPASADASSNFSKSKQNASAKPNLSNQPDSENPSMSKPTTSSKPTVSKQTASSKASVSQESTSSKANVSQKPVSSKADVSQELTSSKASVSKQPISLNTSKNVHFEKPTESQLSKPSKSKKSSSITPSKVPLKVDTYNQISPSKAEMSKNIISSKSKPTTNSKAEVSSKIPTSTTNTPQNLSPSKIDTTQNIPSSKSDLGKEISPSKSDLGKEVSPSKSDLGKEASPSKSDLGKEASPSKSDLGKEASPSKSDLGKEAPPSKSDLGKEVSPSKSDLGKEASSSKPDLGKYTSPSKSDLGKETSPSTSKLGKDASPSKSKIGEKSTPSKSETREQLSPSKVQVGQDIKRPDVLSTENPSKAILEKTTPSKADKGQQITPTEAITFQKVSPSKDETSVPSISSKTSELKTTSQTVASQNISPSKDEASQKTTPSKVDQSHQVKPSNTDISQQTTPSRSDMSKHNGGEGRSQLPSQVPSSVMSIDQMVAEPSDLVDRILEQERFCLQVELDLIGSGDEVKSEEESNLSDGNVSRIASLMAKKCLCDQYRKVTMEESIQLELDLIEFDELSRILAVSEGTTESGDHSDSPGRGGIRETEQSSMMSQIASIGLGVPVPLPRSVRTVESTQLPFSSNSETIQDVSVQVQPASLQPAEGGGNIVSESAVLDRIAIVGLGAAETHGGRPLSSRSNEGMNSGTTTVLIPIQPIPTSDVDVHRIPREEFIRRHTIPIESEMSTMGLGVHHNIGQQNIQTLDQQSITPSLAKLDREFETVLPPRFPPDTRPQVPAGLTPTIPTDSVQTLWRSDQQTPPPPSALVPQSTPASLPSSTAAPAASPRSVTHPNNARSDQGPPPTSAGVPQTTPASLPLSTTAPAASIRSATPSKDVRFDMAPAPPSAVVPQTTPTSLPQTTTAPAASLRSETTQYDLRNSVLEQLSNVRQQVEALKAELNQTRIQGSRRPPPPPPPPPQ